MNIILLNKLKVVGVGYILQHSMLVLLFSLGPLFTRHTLLLISSLYGNV